MHTAVKVHSSAVEGWGRIVDKKMYGYVDDERTQTQCSTDEDIRAITNRVQPPQLPNKVTTVTGKHTQQG